MNFKYAVVFLIALSLVTQAEARKFRPWGYEELQEKSDLIAIIEPTSSEETKDAYPNPPSWESPANFAGHNTTFKVHVILKGEFPSGKSLVVLHFSYSKSKFEIIDGARFTYFLPGPLEFKKQVLKYDKEVGRVMTYSEAPIWLAFLKKKEDGRYEPVTDPYDAVDSFRELHQSSFFAPPDSF